MDKNCLSYWYPQIRGVLTPKTEIITNAPVRALLKPVWNEPWTKREKAQYDRFMTRLNKAALKIGYPVFLRTGHTSAKHQWKDTCHVPGPKALEAHVLRIVEFSECTGVVGLPVHVWAVRKLLPTIPVFTAFSGRLPVCREFRFFARDGRVQCWHPYWPEDSITGHNPSCEDWKARLKQESFLCPEYLDYLSFKTESITRALGGYWSVDWLWTQDGWYLTDMAEGEHSWHWKGCRFDRSN